MDRPPEEKHQNRSGPPWSKLRLNRTRTSQCPQTAQSGQVELLDKPCYHADPPHQVTKGHGSAEETHLIHKPQRRRAPAARDPPETCPRSPASATQSRQHENRRDATLHFLLRPGTTSTTWFHPVPPSITRYHLVPPGTTWLKPDLNHFQRRTIYRRYIQAVANLLPGDEEPVGPRGPGWVHHCYQ